MIFDPEKKVRLSAKTLHMKVDYNPYEGREVTGATDTVISPRARDHRQVASLSAAPDPGRSSSALRAMITSHRDTETQRNRSLSKRNALARRIKGMDNDDSVRCVEDCRSVSLLSLWPVGARN